MDQTIPATAAPRASEARETTWFLLKLLILVILLRSFVFAPFSIPSESMLPRLLIGDYLIVSKWNYGYSRFSLPFGPDVGRGRLFANLPERGDVVVFKAPPGDDVDYIKRVIGLPGDEVQIKGGQLLLNRKLVPRKRIADFVEPLTPNSACAKSDVAKFSERAGSGGSQCRYPRFVETLPGGRNYQILDLENVEADDTGVFVVPAGQLFLMGDNRDRSADSRFPAVENAGIGLVPVENLVGKAWFGIFSTDGTASWIKPWTWFSAARWERTGGGY
jgi:signal peptidase I